MNLFYRYWIGHLLPFVVLLLVSISCQQNDNSVDQFLETLPHEYPEEINRFQSADSVYFRYLPLQTISLDDGTVLLPLLESQMLLQVNTEGEIVKQVARTGRGPGEVLDILSLAQNNDGGILIYDQDNQKVIQFDNQLSYVSEFTPEPFEGTNTSGVLPPVSGDEYLFRHSSFDYLKDKSKQPQTFLTKYNIEDGSHNESIAMQDRPYARLIRDGEVRGATEVLYSPRQLIVKNNEDETIYSFWTGSDEIAELSADFDTVRTIPVDLPAQLLSSEVRDSLKERYRSEQWRTLRDKLPDQKTPVEKMKIDPQNRFWLKLNYRGNSAQWLIMNQEGDPQKIVHLPKDAMLTHVSDNHLGVRLDDITFALFEPVD